MKCSYFHHSQCKSCNLLDKSYAETIAQKEIVLKELFSQHSFHLRPTVGLETSVAGSRSKAKFSTFVLSGKDELTFGITNSTSNSTELEHCPLHAEGINEILPALKTILAAHKIEAYDLKTKKGELKYLLISKSSNEAHPQFLLRFVLRSKESLDRLKKASSLMMELPFNIAVVTANIQPEHKAILEGDEEIILSEEKVIIHQFDEFQLALGARSFFQVTPEIAKKLYNAVAENVSKDNPKSLIDLYCGVGAFSFYASRWCEDVAGVEISKEAIDCAGVSVKMNKSKIQFFAMDVEEYLVKNPRKFEAMVVNPPRRGLNLKIIEKILEIDPAFIYYSSCNAETMTRDFVSLESRYEITSMQIFDMFPYTDHFETLMCLKRKS